MQVHCKIQTCQPYKNSGSFDQKLLYPDETSGCQVLHLEIPLSSIKKQADEFDELIIPFTLGVSFPCWVCVHRHTHVTDDTLTYLALIIARYPRRGLGFDDVMYDTSRVSHDF